MIILYEYNGVSTRGDSGHVVGDKKGIDWLACVLISNYCYYSAIKFTCALPTKVLTLQMLINVPNLHVS